MLYKIQIGDEPYQIINFDFFSSRIRLEIFFNSIAQRWFVNITEPNLNKTITKGMPLVVGANLLDRLDTPYFFRVVDNSRNGLDPQFKNDWVSRCTLYVALKSEELI